jgi:hypothetical protein
MGRLLPVGREFFVLMGKTLPQDDENARNPVERFVNGALENHWKNLG